MKDASTLFRLLGDEVRLRLLRLLTCERLNVGELTVVLGIAQSGVSRHVGMLRAAGLIDEEREGGFTFLRANSDVTRADLEPVWALLRTRFAAARRTAVVRADDVRLRDILRRRRESAETHGSTTGAGVRQLVPGRSWSAWARGLGLLLPPMRVVDLGCGEGFLTLEVARWAGHVIGVDRSAQVLKRAKTLAAKRGVDNVEWRQGEIEHLPVEDGTAELALLSQALHHAADPMQAMREAVRVVTESGRVLVLDLVAHEAVWTRERLGDRWFGFSPRDLTGLMTDAGLIKTQVWPVTDDRAEASFDVVAGIGTKPTTPG